MTTSTTIRPDPAAIKGLVAARFLRSLVVARGDPIDAAAYAEGNAHWLQHSAIVNAVRAPVAAVDSMHAASLMAPIGSDFAEYVRPLSIIGRLTAARRVPFDTRLFGQTGGAVASFVGATAPKPVTSMTFAAGEATLERRKVAALSVVTEELARSNNILAERTLLNDLARATAEALDRAFIDPSNVGSTGDSPTPASITSSATVVESTGKTLAQIDADLAVMVQTLLTAGSNLTSAVWVVHPRTAVYLSMLRGTGGALAFPSITAAGGTLVGLPAIVSGNTPMSDDSDQTTSITLLDSDGLLLADDGAAELGVTTQASIEMSDTPTEGEVQQVSLWQMGLACLRAERWVNWLPRREGVAVTLAEVEY